MHTSGASHQSKRNRSGDSQEFNHDGNGKYEYDNVQSSHAFQARFESLLGNQGRPLRKLYYVASGL